MRILLIDLTHDEAADAAVVANVATLQGFQFLPGQLEETNAATLPAVTQSPSQVFGGVPQPAAAAPQPTAPVAPAPIESTPSAASVFGGIPAPVAAPIASATPTPASPASSAPAAPATGSTVIEIDNRGFPWDGRVHSDPPSRLKSDGTWRQKRSTAKSPITPELIAQVEAEYVAAGYGPSRLAQTTSQAPATPPMTPEQVAMLQQAQAQPGTPVGALATALAPAPVMAPAPAPAPAPVPIPAPQPASPAPVQAAVGAADPMENFGRFMLRTGQLIQQKKLAPDWTLESVKPHGVSSLNVLMSRPDLVKWLNMSLDAAGLPQAVEG